MLMPQGRPNYTLPGMGAGELFGAIRNEIDYITIWLIFIVTGSLKGEKGNKFGAGGLEWLCLPPLFLRTKEGTRPFSVPASSALGE